MDFFRHDGALYLDLCHPTARYPLAMVHTHLVASACAIRDSQYRMRGTTGD